MRTRADPGSMDSTSKWQVVWLSRGGELMICGEDILDLFVKNWTLNIEKYKENNFICNTEKIGEWLRFFITNIGLCEDHFSYS